jgi:uncharacterized protein with HEPN domain
MRRLLAFHDILNSIERMESYTKGVSYDSFNNNQMMIDAGLRNVLIHEYFGIDESIVWEVATNNLKEVKPRIVRAIQEEGDFI